MVTPRWGFYPFAINGDGVLAWNVHHQGDKAPKPFTAPEMRTEIINRMSAITGAQASTDNIDSYKSLLIPLPALADEDNFKVFTDTCLWIQSMLTKHHSENE
jgi:hypothetical protein